MELLKPLQRALEVYARRAIYDPGEVEDALQTVIVNIFRDFNRFEEGTNFRAWVFRYLNLEILSRNRNNAEKRHEPFAEEPWRSESWEQAVAEATFDELLDSTEEILDHCDDMLADAVRQLPETEKSVFLLRALGEFTYREIAAVLKIPVGTVMSGLSRSRAMLRSRLFEFSHERGVPHRRTHEDEATQEKGDRS